MEMLMSSKLLEHTKKTHESIQVLFENDFDEAALILMYAWIDRVAWLSVEREESTGNDFKNWVDEYLLKHHEMACTAEELWGARCGLLHTGSPEAKVTRKNTGRKVFYITGDTIKAHTRNDDEVFIRVADLHSNFIGAIAKFAEHLEDNPDKLKTVDRKLGNILTKISKS
jgi:hypothetical protein